MDLIHLKLFFLQMGQETTLGCGIDLYQTLACDLVTECCKRGFDGQQTQAKFDCPGSSFGSGRVTQALAEHLVASTDAQNRTPLLRCLPNMLCQALPPEP